MKQVKSPNGVIQTISDVAMEYSTANKKLEAAVEKLAFEIEKAGQ